MSMFDSFAGDTMAFLTGTHGEPGFVQIKGGEPRPVSITVLRDQLQTRGTDKNQRLDYDVAVQIRMADYPGGVVNVGGDKVTVKVRKDDPRPTTKAVSKIISQVGGVFVLELD